jgi:hypothetical protein
MSERLLGFDPATGLAQWWLQDGEGNWAQRSSQHVEALLDLNREAQSHCDPYNAARDVRMVARIPLIVIAKWRNELGVDYWNPDHQDKVDALLNDADWRWLRTDFAASAPLLIAGSAALRAAHGNSKHEERAPRSGALPAKTLTARSAL